jgi:hypothetical protein
MAKVYRFIKVGSNILKTKENEIIQQKMPKNSEIKTNFWVLDINDGQRTYFKTMTFLIICPEGCWMTTK